MSRVVTKKTIKAPAGRVWEIVREFGGLERFIAAVNTTKLEGSGIGMKRTMVMADGNTIVERLEALDEEKRSLRYSVLETKAPIADYIADMIIRDAEGGGCEIEWVSEFSSPEDQRAKTERMVSGLHQMTIRGLDRFCREA